jgi:FkbM family methyltransferase
MIKGLMKRVFNKIGFDVRRLPAYGTGTLAFLKQYEINSVIDVGANSGQFAREVRSVLPSAYLYSFEPLTEEYARLVHNMNKNDERFRAFNVALGESNGKRVMFRDNFTPSSSLLRPTEVQKRTFPHTGTVRETTITIRTLDEIVAENSLCLEPQLFIKLDVQGYEQRVIEGGLHTLNKARLLMIEENYHHFYEGQPSFEELFALLLQIGFKYKGSVNQSYHPASGLPLFADGIFVRP